MGRAYKPLFKTQNAKLIAPHKGPYTVIKKVLPLAYQLNFSKSKEQINPVVSIQYLLPYKANNDDKFNW